MGVSIQALLINFLFILLPLFFYQIFWLDKNMNNSKIRKVLLVSLMSFSIILCMNFPVKFGPEFLFDLRYIPYLLGILYLGFPAALTGFIIILSFRYSLGGEGVYVNLFVLSLVFLSGPFLHKFYLKLQRKRRLIFSLFAGMLSAFMLVILVLLKSETPYFDHDIFLNFFILIQGLSMWFTTYTIEEMAYNKQMRQRMLYTEKLRVISDLSASISHEIRNQLTVTKGFLQMLYLNDLTNDKKKQYIDFALMELERGETIITDFLSLTKNETISKVPIDVIKELQYTINIVTPYALINNVDLKLETVITDEVLVNGDYSQFRQCFINLQKNSIEAMPNGGELSIRVSTDRNKVVIESEDTGVGMSKEELARIGTPYYTTKEKGTGLGTSLIFSIIQSMNGTIDVKSEKGKGTKFIIRVPISQSNSNVQEQIS